MYRFIDFLTFNFKIKNFAFKIKLFGPTKIKQPGDRFSGHMSRRYYELANKNSGLKKVHSI